jgi:hypothetical protein
MVRHFLASAALGVLVAQLPLAADAQTLPAEQAFVPRATVTVENNTPVPQTVVGTNVTPFQLMPHQQAKLEMTAAPPPPAAPGEAASVQFQYAVGQAPGPQCHGAIDMSLRTEGSIPGQYEITNCTAHSLGTEGGDCNIVVSARNALCQGGLAFSAH